MAKRPNSLVFTLLVAVALERMASDVTEGGLGLWLVRELGMNHSEVGQHYEAMSAGVFAPVLGGLVAIALGPRLTLALGAFVAAVGYGALALSPSLPPIVGMVLVAVGGGIFRPAWMVALAQQFEYPRGNQRAAVFIAAFLGLNLTAMLAGVASPLLYDLAVPWLAFAVSAGLSLLAVVLGARLHLAHRRAEPERDALRFGRRPELGALLLLLVLLPSDVGAPVVTYIFEAAVPTTGIPGSSVSYSAAHIVAGVWSAALMIAMVWVFTAAARRKAPPLSLHVIGAGLILAALGMGAAALISFGPMVDLANLAARIGPVLFASGELVGVLVIARVAADTQPRTATLVVGLFVVARRAVSFAGLLTYDGDHSGAIAGSAAALTLIGGALVIKNAGRIQRALYSPNHVAE